MIGKDLCTHTIIILRQDKSLRDHGRAALWFPRASDCFRRQDQK
jgi:hypothetical protein